VYFFFLVFYVRPHANVGSIGRLREWDARQVPLVRLRPSSFLSGYYRVRVPVAHRAKRRPATSPPVAAPPSCRAIAAKIIPAIFRTEYSPREPPCHPPRTVDRPSVAPTVRQRKRVVIDFPLRFDFARRRTAGSMVTRECRGIGPRVDALIVRIRAVGGGRKSSPKTEPGTIDVRRN